LSVNDPIDKLVNDNIRNCWNKLKNENVNVSVINHLGENISNPVNKMTDKKVNEMITKQVTKMIWTVNQSP